MGILNWRRKKQPTNTGFKKPEEWLIDAIFNRIKSRSGVNVDPVSAMGVPTVYACVNRISNSIAGLPLTIYERTEEGKREATGHRLYSKLHDAPNPDMTSFDFRYAMQANLSLRKNAVAIIIRNGFGEVADIYPVDPADLVMQQTPDGLMTYRVKNRPVPNQNIIHLKGFSLNGLYGVELIQSARDAIGLAIALQDNASTFFGNGCRPGAILEHPDELSQEAAKRLKETFEAAYKGNDNAGSVAVLEEGLKYVAQRHNNTDSQFIEARKYQDLAIAQLFGIPPHKVALLDRATFSNIEQQSIEYVTDTIIPQLRIWEQTLNHKLLKEQEKGRYYFEFKVDTLIGADIKSRYEAYAIGKNGGWLNTDEIREKENMNPLPDGLGQRYLEPLNMVPAGSEREDNSNE